MKVRHTPFHWVAVALVTAAALLTLSEAWGQTTGADAMFEGRPALAGAQGGQGAQAGMPQGGLGVQGSDTVKKKEPGLAREQRSSVRKAKRAAKRTVQRGRHGTAPIDSRSLVRQ